MKKRLKNVGGLKIMRIFVKEKRNDMNSNTQVTARNTEILRIAGVIFTEKIGIKAWDIAVAIFDENVDIDCHSIATLIIENYPTLK